MPWKKQKGMPKVERKTLVIDAEGKVVGRIATQAARILIGKHKASYEYHLDGGDFVKVINAKKAEFTGKKWEEKVHFHSSNRPGGIRRVSVKKLREERPEEIIAHAVKYMLPKNTHLAARMKRLTVTA
jgi:large subunit ribosomal protein L13